MAASAATAAAKCVFGYVVRDWKDQEIFSPVNDWLARIHFSRWSLAFNRSASKYTFSKSRRAQ